MLWYNHNNWICNDATYSTKELTVHALHFFLGNDTRLMWSSNDNQNILLMLWEQLSFLSGGNVILTRSL
jgi:hypothetical protein